MSIPDHEIEVPTPRRSIPRLIQRSPMEDDLDDKDLPPDDDDEDEEDDDDDEEEEALDGEPESGEDDE